jgi:hypothetical protein
MYIETLRCEGKILILVRKICNLKLVLIVNEEVVKVLMCCVHVEKRVLQWVSCWAVFFTSKCRTSIMGLRVNRKVRLESTVTVDVKISSTPDTLQNLRKSVKLSQTLDSLGRNCVNI